MEVCFVHQNHCFARSFCDEVAYFVLGRDTRSGVVRIADVNQTALGSDEHFWQIVRKAAGQGHLYYFSTIGAGILEYGFESWVRRDKLSVLGSGKCFRAQFQNLARAVAQQDFVAIDMVQRRQLID